MESVASWSYAGIWRRYRGKQGIQFVELFAPVIFGGITVFIGLASRPGVLP